MKQIEKRISRLESRSSMPNASDGISALYEKELIDEWNDMYPPAEVVKEMMTDHRNDLKQRGILP